MFSNALPGVMQMPLGPKLVLRKVFGSRLEMTSALESPGIQIIDVILWLFARSLRSDLPTNCQALLDYIYSRAYQEDFSFAGAQAGTEQTLDALEQAPLPPGAAEDALRLHEEAEQMRLGQMDAYARAKVA